MLMGFKIYNSSKKGKVIVKLIVYNSSKKGNVIVDNKLTFII